MGAQSVKRALVVVSFGYLDRFGVKSLALLVILFDIMLCPATNLAFAFEIRNFKLERLHCAGERLKPA